MRSQPIRAIYEGSLAPLEPRGLSVTDYHSPFELRSEFYPSSDGCVEALGSEALVVFATHALEHPRDDVLGALRLAALRLIGYDDVICSLSSAAASGVRPAGVVVVGAADDAGSFDGASLEAMGGERVGVLDVAGIEVCVG